MEYVQAAEPVRRPDKHVFTRGPFVPSILVANLCKTSSNIVGVDFLISIRYISTLEERVAFLEACLPDHADDHLENTIKNLPRSSLSEPVSTSFSREAHRGSYRRLQAGSRSEDVDHEEGESLVDGVAYLSLCASGTTDTTPEPYYVGSSSGATIARVIQSSVYRGSGRKSTVPATADQSDEAVEAAPSMKPGFSTTDGSIPALPNEEQARMLFDFFFERIHPRWPLLDRAIYEEIFENQYIPGKLSVTESSILHLIYAITARFLAVTKKPCDVDDEVSISSTYG